MRCGMCHRLHAKQLNMRIAAVETAGMQTVHHRTHAVYQQAYCSTNRIWHCIVRQQYQSNMTVDQQANPI